MSENFINQFQNFLTQCLPNRKDEDWKYLNLKALTEKNINQINKETSSIDFDGDQIIFQSGLIDHNKSKINSKLIKIEEIIPQNIELDPKFSFYNPFHDLSTTINSVAYKIRIKASAEEQNLLLIHPGCGFSAPRIELELEDQAELNLVEIYLSSPEEIGFHCPLLEVNLQKNSKLNYVKLCEENHQTTHLGSLITNQSQDSQFYSHHILLGGDICRQEIVTNLNEKNAIFHGNGLYLAHNHQQHDIHAIINHYSSHAESDLHYKGIANHQGKAIFNGRVVVHPGADFSVAHQKNSNLLLSNQAEINPKPDLEIYADEVECSHGATIGKLDENALFYFKSRGIPENQAKKILMQAFIQESIDRINQKWIKDIITKAIQSEQVL